MAGAPLGPTAHYPARLRTHTGPAPLVDGNASAGPGAVELANIPARPRPPTASRTDVEVPLVLGLWPTFCGGLTDSDVGGLW